MLARMVETARRCASTKLTLKSLCYQVQIFEEVPELAARAISYLLEAHPRSVVENIIRAKGLTCLCPAMTLTDPMNHHEKGKTERAIKVNQTMVKDSPSFVI